MLVKSFFVLVDGLFLAIRIPRDNVAGPMGWLGLLNCGGHGISSLFLIRLRHFALLLSVLAYCVHVLSALSEIILK